MSQARVLIVHPEPSILALLGSMLQSLGHPIEEASNDRSAVRRLDRGGIDLILAGVDPYDPESLELLSYSRRKHPEVPVVLLFPGPCPDRARDAMRMGATTVLKFPMPATELRAAVTQACEWAFPPGGTNGSAAPAKGHSSHASSTNGHSAHGNGVVHPFAEVVTPRVRPARALSIEATPRPRVSNTIQQLLGEDAAFRQAADLAYTVAPSKVPVLIVGEQGTGKTLIARSIHQQSGRGDQPFLEVSCLGIDELGLERELFGQKFEGADGSERLGRLSRAQHGTILIDEVAALPPALQSRLLTILIDGEFQQLGASEPVSCDVRFVLSTRENLPALVEQGLFRRELYDRINDICLKLPPLRHRGLDVISLAEHFMAGAAADFGKPAIGFTPDALDLLADHEWPGNVRELESVVQRGVALSQGPKVTAANLAVGMAPTRAIRPVTFAPKPHIRADHNLRPLKEALEEPEKQIIVQALRALNWNRQETARVLDINRTTLYKKMKKYGLLMEEPALLN